MTHALCNGSKNTSPTSTKSLLTVGGPKAPRSTGSSTRRSQSSQSQEDEETAWTVEFELVTSPTGDPNTCGAQVLRILCCIVSDCTKDRLIKAVGSAPYHRARLEMILLFPRLLSEKTMFSAVQTPYTAFTTKFYRLGAGRIHERVTDAVDQCVCRDRFSHVLCSPGFCIRVHADGDSGESLFD
jgi:hypothetical protein